MADDENILDQLPEYKFFRKCQSCGATDWTACNLTPDNRVVLNCNRCPNALVTLGLAPIEPNPGGGDEL